MADEEAPDSDLDPDHLCADHLRRIADLLNALTTAESGPPGQGVGIGFGGNLEVVVGHALDGEIFDPNPDLVGQLRCVDGEWVFVPLVPQQVWSTNQQRWVSREEHADEVAAALTTTL